MSMDHVHHLYHQQQHNAGAGDCSGKSRASRPSTKWVNDGSRALNKIENVDKMNSRRDEARSSVRSGSWTMNECEGYCVSDES